MSLNRFVFKTIYENNQVLYNTVTKVVLPHNATFEELKSNYFLENQEYESIVFALEKYPEIFNLTVIPTWECNLRCSHCSVLNLLEKEDKRIFEIKKIRNFSDNWFKLYPKTKYCVFALLGGEPLLRTSQCLEMTKEIKESCKINNVECLTTLTTNLTQEINEETLSLFDELFEIGVSLDGNKDEHNWQRKALNHEKDLWTITYNNLKLLVEYGFADKIRVKAAIRDQFITKENYEKFLNSLGNIGIDLDKITYGTIHPTDHHVNLQSENYTDYILKRINPIPVPCCKYRVKSQFHIEPDGTVYDAFFGYAREKLGHVSEPIEEIINNRRQKLLDRFPPYRDKGCQECSVVGYCFGGCVNSRTLVNDNPSKFCNQKGLTEHIEYLAKEGRLVDIDKNTNPIKFCEEQVEKNKLSLQLV